MRGRPGRQPARNRRAGTWPALLLPTLLAVACADDRPPPPAPPPDPAPVPYEPADVADIDRPPPPAFCSSLASMVAREPDGYAQLRGAPLADEHWRAAVTLPGTENCTIEGAGWPRARVSCEGRLLDGDDRGRIEAEFERMAQEIDACLARPSWFPRVWERGQLFEFAMAERQLAWLDQSTTPPTAVVLKAQQDLASQDFQIKVNLESVR